MVQLEKRESVAQPFFFERGGEMREIEEEWQEVDSW